MSGLEWICDGADPTDCSAAIPPNTRTVPMCWLAMKVPFILHDRMYFPLSPLSAAAALHFRSNANYDISPTRTSNLAGSVKNIYSCAKCWKCIMSVSDQQVFLRFVFFNCCYPPAQHSYWGCSPTESTMQRCDNEQVMKGNRCFFQSHLRQCRRDSITSVCQTCFRMFLSYLGCELWRGVTSKYFIACYPLGLVSSFWSRFTDVIFGETLCAFPLETCIIHVVVSFTRQWLCKNRSEPRSTTLRPGR